jgi:hypothetical protein
VEGSKISARRVVTCVGVDLRLTLPNRLRQIRFGVSREYPKIGGAEWFSKFFLPIVWHVLADFTSSLTPSISAYSVKFLASHPQSATSPNINDGGHHSTSWRRRSRWPRFQSTTPSLPAGAQEESHMFPMWCHQTSRWA